ncbi:restriction endonuclease subunit S [Peptoniphilus raoultii]|uniref:restriction endonuclease subunit S n=1 Tax=Peptoniphilus raoultii TaxID=1776387 RepID=UPI0008D930A9|nr:restriction endonuclease subunit S [Peptoniphilus raoultii]
MKILEEIENEKVEWKKLWELTIWDKKFSGVEKFKQREIKKYHYFLSGKLKEFIDANGTIKILTTYKSDLYADRNKIKDYISCGEVVCIPSGGNPIVQYYKGEFITADNRIATSINTKILSNKFLYYYLLNKIDLITSFYRGAGIKHPDMTKILNINIPLPSIETQEKIVEILDKFTSYVTELQIELQNESQARQKQYEYYRNMLLSEDLFFKSNKFLKETNLEELCNISAGGDVPKNNFTLEKNDSYNIPIISNGIGENAFYGYTNEAKITGPAVTISARGTIGNAEYRDYSFYPIIRLISLTPKNNNECNPKYLYYFMKKRKYNLPPSGIQQLTIPMIKKIEIKLPSFDLQVKIVEILDKFEEFVNEIEGLLPQEIEQRQKQYEYYCERLLTFK